MAAAVAAEVRHYRRHHDRGRDAASLAALRLECAAVIAAELGGDAPPPERLAELLLASLHFELMPDALPALDELAGRGLRLGVVSNWDCSLPGVLAALGVADRFQVIAASASAGASKPDPAIFLGALDRLGVVPARALHCGDSPAHDCAGARAAGLQAVLVDRHWRAPQGPCRRIRTLLDLTKIIYP